jgi:bifunctional non-homologous end joining protein LigD
MAFPMFVTPFLRTTATLRPAPPLNDLRVMEPSNGWQPFDDAGWSFALMSGGHRLLAQVQHGEVVLHSRQQVDVTDRFAELAAGLSHWPAGRTVFDGELCALGDQGVPSRALLHRRSIGLGGGGGRLVYRVFDLLVLEGTDARDWPWHDRQRALALLPLADLGGVVERQKQVRERGRWLHTQAMALGLPGVLARRCDSRYGDGEGHPWRLVAAAAGCPAPDLP